MESLSGKPLVMVVQPGQYWVSDYLSLFLRDISFWYFLSNSLMWSLLVMIPDIFSKNISDLFFIDRKVSTLGRESTSQRLRLSR